MTGQFLKFIHLTDAHLVPHPQTLFGINVHENLERAIDSINHKFNDAEFCMITGDLAHWGDAQAYSELTEILNKLSMPYHLMIGNHDARRIAKDSLPTLPWSQDGFLNYRVKTTIGDFIVLDTVNDGKNNGRLCEIRLRWLRQQLLETQSAGDDVYLFMHHPPMNIGISAMDAIGLVNSEDMIALLQGFKHIRHLFFGHLHRSCHGSWRGIPFSTVKAICYQVELRLDGCPNLTCSHENPAYAVVLIGRDSVIIHDHSFTEEGKTFDYNRGKPEDGEIPEHQKEWN